ncbi:hypothetical protein MKZ38_007380 [Zalerion maritima]|uniref:Uncharacterized protein n=1 Tax=Zalerion maritima TaxID=339359 RepID=A0AAD5RMR2_9PEZI|nr:hypothetical protein MKZ38_007380 [Zalerion maritima]
MVVPTAPQPSSTYQLWKVFSLPGSDGGSTTAFAVESDIADKIISTYTVLVKASLISLWSIGTAAVFFSMLRQSKSDHLTASIWNHRASITNQLADVLTVGFARIRKSKSYSKWPLPLGVASSVLVALAAQAALSILIAPLLVLDHAAPVNPSSIFMPAISQLRSQAAKRVELKAQTALRAAGAALVAEDGISNRVGIHPHAASDRGDGEKDLQFDYDYHVTGAEMGLQKVPGLKMFIEGSCRTEYDWYINSTVGSSGYVYDTYAPFGNESNLVNVSRSDGWIPMARFTTGPETQSSAQGNWTWSAIVSSVGRQSFEAGDDPWYRTEEDPDATSNDPQYIIRGGRPALSCWQSSLWGYGGQNQTLTRISRLPGINETLSDDINRVLLRFFDEPLIVTISLGLGAAALSTSEGAWGSSFNAAESSIENDLTRLLMSAYIASANVFTDLTLVRDRFKNELDNELNITADGVALEGAEEFVVWSSNAVSTLSLAGIIAIPLVTLLLWGILWLLLRKTVLRSVDQVYDAGLIFKTLARDADMLIANKKWQKRLSLDGMSGGASDKGDGGSTRVNSGVPAETNPLMKNEVRVSSQSLYSRLNPPG